MPEGEGSAPGHDARPYGSVRRSTPFGVVDRGVEMPIRALRAIFWNGSRCRARVPWLIAIPLFGAFVATSADEAVPGEPSLPVAALLASAAPALVAVLLVAVSSRWLGGRRLVDYGLAIDRRWIRELAAGLAVGLLAVAVPFLIAISAGWAEVVATFDAGDLALATGILLYVLAMLCTGLWEELVLRGVFLCNAADGLRRWLTPRRAVVGGLVLSSLVFALGHLAQTEASAKLLTFVLSGVVFGVVYLLSGNLALVIGAHAAFNITSNVLFARAGGAADGLSAVMRLEVDSSLPLLESGGVLEVVAFGLLGIFSLLWLRYTRDSVSIQLAALGLEGESETTGPTIEASASIAPPVGRGSA
jgi:uncharacterized protein